VYYPPTEPQYPE
jgi:hypothetical protein